MPGAGAAKARRRWEVGSLLVLLSTLVGIGALSGYRYYLNREMAAALNNPYRDPNWDSKRGAILFRRGASVDTRGAHRMTLLMIACLEDDEKLCRELLSRGAQVNAKDYLGATPLYFAASRKNLGLMRLLLAHGATPNASSSWQGWTPIYEIINFGYTEHEDAKTCLAGVRLLLDAGADVLIQDREGRTPLEFASHFGVRRVLPMLRQAQAAQEAKQMRNGFSGSRPGDGREKRGIR